MSSAPITALELRQLLVQQPDLRLLDVRTGGEFASIHIPGSCNVPLDELSGHAARLAAVDSPMILVCQTGGRAVTAQEQLAKVGKTDLRVLEGGIGSWLVAEGEVVRGPEKWSLERQVRGVAGFIVLLGIVLSYLFSSQWRLLSGAIGAGLLFAAVSNTCMMGMALAKLPYNRGPKCDIDCVIESLRAPQRQAA